MPHRLWTTLAPPRIRPSVTPPWTVTGRVVPMMVSSPGRVDQQPAGPRAEPVGTGDAHGVRLRRCQIPAAATGGGLDHGGDREGRCGDPFGLGWTTSRRPAGNDATVAGDPTSCSAAGR